MSALPRVEVSFDSGAAIAPPGDRHHQHHALPVRLMRTKLMGRPEMVAEAARSLCDAAVRLRPELELTFPRQAPDWYQREIELILGEARELLSQASAA